MPMVIMEIKIAKSFGLSIFRKIIISGIDNAVTAIIKASVVPIGKPFSTRDFTIGTIPAALEYKGTPIITATGTASGLFLFAILAKMFSGAYPCIKAPMATPKTI